MTIHHKVMADKTVTAALLCEVEERLQSSKKIEDVSGFTAYGVHGELMENSEHCSRTS